MRTIAIVGGGFSGTVLATMLLRHPPPTPTRLVLIERGPRVGRGVAFAMRDFPYLLNVPVGRMSANPADPLEFLRFMQRRQPDTDAESFLPRAWYGDYLEESLQAASLSAPPHIRLDVIRASVTSIRRNRRDLPLRLRLDDATRALRRHGGARRRQSAAQAPRRGAGACRASRLCRGSVDAVGDDGRRRPAVPDRHRAHDGGRRAGRRGARGWRPHTGALATRSDRLAAGGLPARHSLRQSRGGDARGRAIAPAHAARGAQPRTNRGSRGRRLARGDQFRPRRGADALAAHVRGRPLTVPAACATLLGRASTSPPRGGARPADAPAPDRPTAGARRPARVAAAGSDRRRRPLAPAWASGPGAFRRRPRHQLHRSRLRPRAHPGPAVAIPGARWPRDARSTWARASYRPQWRRDRRRGVAGHEPALPGADAARGSLGGDRSRGARRPRAAARGPPLQPAATSAHHPKHGASVRDAREVRTENAVA